MSDKDLQRVTEYVSYIGQAAARRRSLPACRHHITQKVKIAWHVPVAAQATAHHGCWQSGFRWRIV